LSRYDDLGARPARLRKLGTVDLDMVETTPVVFRNRLFRFEYVRQRYWNNQTGESYFRFIDVDSAEATPSFGVGYHLGCAHVEDGKAFAYGTNAWGGDRIRAFWSDDLEAWEEKTAMELPGWRVYNTSVCRGREGYAMAIEVGDPPELVGKRFTIFFAESRDLLNWNLLPLDRVFSKEKYTACPALRFLDDHYYMIYLEAYPGPSYKPHVVRSRDLVSWEESPRGAVMEPSLDDKMIANPELTEDQVRRISRAVDINNSDVDLCEYRGKTHVFYSWGNQQGTEFLARAVLDTGLRGLFRMLFPEKKG
jgi:hypothetical protein